VKYQVRIVLNVMIFRS